MHPCSNDCWSSNQVLALIAGFAIAFTLLMVLLVAVHFRKGQNGINKPIPIEDNSSRAVILIGRGVLPLTSAGLSSRQ